MAGLVHELQRDALNQSVNISSLLRKALVVSRKLNVSDIQEWITFELNGYPFNDEKVPEYRVVHGAPHVKNPYHGWQPLFFEDEKHADTLSSTKCTQSVSELEHLASTENAGHLRMDYPSGIENALMRRMSVPLKPSLIVQKSFLIGILDSVRSRVLDWALLLEEQGISGEGMSFTEKEKQAAHSVTNNITTNIGNMTNSQLLQDSPNAVQSLSVTNDLSQVNKFIKAIKEQLEDIPLNSSEKQELQADVMTIETQLSSTNTKSVIVTESLKSIRAILEGAAGNIVASGLLTQLTSLLV